VFDQSDDLIALAHSQDVQSRERLLMGLVVLCEQKSDEPERNQQTKALIDQVFMILARQAETEVRRKLAEHIAPAVWAPPNLIAMLALDEIEIARPVIAASPLLADTDLIRLIVEATLEHQIEVARRPRISAAVVDALLEQNEAPALLALVGNETAQIGAQGMERLVEASRRMPALRAPLTRHPKMSGLLGARLYTWVGEALRAALAERFELDEAALSSAIDTAVMDARVGIALKATEPPHEQQSMETSLVEKLDAAGQLKPGFLLRTLREHKFGLFLAALARLAGLETSEVRRGLNSNQPELLALACIAAHVDRGAFMAVLSAVRDLNGGRPDGGPTADARAAQAFANTTPASAAGEFRAALQLL